MNTHTNYDPLTKKKMHPLIHKNKNSSHFEHSTCLSLMFNRYLLKKNGILVHSISKENLFIDLFLLNSDHISQLIDSRKMNLAAEF